MKFSDYYFSPGARVLSVIGGILIGGSVALFGLFSGLYRGWIWGVIIGAGIALVLSLLLPFRLWLAETPYRRIRETIAQPLLLERSVRYTVPDGAMNGYFLLTQNRMILLSFERGEQRMELAREDIKSIVLEENSIRIFLNNTKFVSFFAVNSEQIYQLLRREGWNA